MPYKDKEKQLEYQRRWMRKRRQEFLGDKECTKCGTKDNIEIHHRDPDKKIDHRIWSWSKDRIRKELEKCDFLCYDCHLEKTSESFRLEWKHGSLTGYKSHGCRCDKCREAVKLHQRKYRANGGYRQGANSV